jgi:hypothetical protein
VDIAAGPERVWEALVAQFSGPARRGAPFVASLLGCRERSVNGGIEEEGSTIVGFRVESALAPSRLSLAGQHRFSRYGLTFEIDDLGGGRSRLRAITDAEFPGAAGSVYRALVIGTRMHVVAVRRILAALRARAESSVNGSDPGRGCS